MTKSYAFLSRSALSTGALGLALISAPAFAQDAAPADGSEGDAIIVTGSRLARPDLEANSPLNVVTAQDISLRASSANIENVLNDLPQVTAVTSSTSNNPGGGVATANLRNLGGQRTLVLVDGRRYMSFDVTQQVDLNTIPSSLLERVDVVTGGQSAVYGSDAIAGVVNFVLKRDFEGVELGSSYTMTERGDGQIWDINGTIGSNFADGRGNVTLYGSYTKRKPTFAGERSFSRNALNDDQDGSPIYAAGGSPSIPQGRVNIPGLGALLGNGGIPGCTNVDIQAFNPDGSSKCYTAGDGYNFSPINYLQVPQERFIISAMAEYEINEHFTPYLETTFANNRVTAQLAATPIGNGTPFGEGVTGPLTLQVDSPFFAPAFQNALAALDTDGDGYVSAPGWNFRTTQIGPRANFDERNAFRIVAGMKGSITGDFSYDGYYMYSRTKNSQRQLGNVAIDRFLAATTTAFDANGNLVCAGGQVGCAPANIFGLNNLSQEAIDYISIGATNLEEYTTQVASFAITNPNLVDFGAGGVGLALGAEWRSENGAITPDSFLSSGNVAGFNPGQPTAGGYSVTEFFGEIRVPLLKDTFIHSLELNGAARYSNYSNAPGNVFTWSAGASLAPVEDLVFRGQYQKAVRGPSVNELFLGNTVSFAGNADGCATEAVPTGQLRDICLAQGVPAAILDATGAAGATARLNLADPNNVNPLTFLGGNSDLQEETAKTYTLGAVFTPSFVPRFSLTVDYYNIKIDGLILSGVGTDVIGRLCFDRFEQAYCDAVTRNSLGQIDSFRDGYVNSGGLKTSGVDVTARYSLPLGAVLGSEDTRLSFQFNGTRLINYRVTPVVGLDFDYQCAGNFGAQCGVPTPKWRHTFRTSLTTGALTTSVMWRYLGKANDDDPDTLYGVERMKAQNYFDLTTSFDATDNLNLQVGVSNMFDKQPPLSASTQSGGNGEQSNTFPTFYDVLGRSFFVSGKIRF
ncbi:TonB-dependent receptor domain-containing protein [Sphingomonas sanxanigenens]|uniref:TonB-dependent receptor domain-containing protein n=1 Tax=Sphingomonas sanxanigenens TaxID=397260 RepID=UPI00046D52BF|nr:TonB-dependent receptor [Sphingomonas sanxanigenens]